MSRAPLPLHGLRVAVTRPPHAADELVRRLEEAGAAAVRTPLTRIAPPPDARPLRGALDRIEAYDWIIFTSANAIRAFADPGILSRSGARIAAVGSATAAAVREMTSRDADVIPTTFSAGGLVDALLARGPLQGARVLWPRAERADERLARELIEAGALLDAPVAYRTVPNDAGAHELVRHEQGGLVDVITFTAPSAVDCYAGAADGGTRCVIAVIGATTAAAARSAGIPVHVQPEQPIISALVAALARHYKHTAG